MYEVFHNEKQSISEIISETLCNLYNLNTIFAFSFSVPKLGFSCKKNPSQCPNI